MLRYLYRPTLVLSSRPQSTNPFIFKMKVHLIALHCDIRSMRELTKQLLLDTSHPRNVEVFLAAVEQAQDDCDRSGGRRWLDVAVRATLLLRVVTRLHWFMACESFRVLMGKRPDVELALLEFMASGTAAIGVKGR
jgi:hypothetical protein